MFLNSHGQKFVPPTTDMLMKSMVPLPILRPPFSMKTPMLSLPGAMPMMTVKSLFGNLPPADPNLLSGDQKATQ